MGPAPFEDRVPEGLTNRAGEAVDTARGPGRPPPPRGEGDTATGSRERADRTLLARLAQAGLLA